MGAWHNGHNITLVDNENTLKSFWVYSGLRLQVQEIGSNSRGAGQAGEASYVDPWRQAGNRALPSERGLKEVLFRW